MIFILERHPLLNVVQRKHFRWYAKEKEKWQNMILAQYRLKHKVKCEVTITRSYKGVKADEDGLVGGAKMVVDALRDNNVIVDDNEQWVKVYYKQIQDSKPFTRIEIKPFKED